MGRRPYRSADEKMQIVISVLRGEMTQVEAARRLEMSQTTVAKWQKQFLDGAHEALSRGDNPRPPASKRETELEAQVDELTRPGGGLRRAAALAERGGSLPPFEDLEVARREAGMTVRRFCERFGIPPSTWYSWRSAELAGRTVRRWPAPAVDAAEPVAAKLKEDDRFSPWGHRKIWGLMRADGVAVSQSSVKRALRRRGLLLPVRYQAERRALARARKGVFKAPTPRRNRVWQTDFSEFETTTAGKWMLTGLVDYWAKVALVSAANATQTAQDAVATLEAAIAEAERLMGRTLLEDCVDPETGEVFPVVIVSDNGPATSPTSSPASSPPGRGWPTYGQGTGRPRPTGSWSATTARSSTSTSTASRSAAASSCTTSASATGVLYNEIRPHEALDLYPPMPTYVAEPMSFEDERVFVETTRLSFEALNRQRAVASDPGAITPIFLESVQNS